MIDLEWIDRYSPTRKTYKAITDASFGQKGSPSSALSSYRTQPEAKSLDRVTLQPASGRSHGVLQRRPIIITAYSVNYIGKESNQLQEVEAGIHHDVGEILNEYKDPAADDWEKVLRPALVMAVEGGMTADAHMGLFVDVQRSIVWRWRHGKARPQQRHQTAVMGISPT